MVSAFGYEVEDHDSVLDHLLLVREDDRLMTALSCHFDHDLALLHHISLSLSLYGCKLLLSEEPVVLLSACLEVDCHL